jgi:hypothetical protein
MTRFVFAFLFAILGIALGATIGALTGLAATGAFLTSCMDPDCGAVVAIGSALIGAVLGAIAGLALGLAATEGEARRVYVFGMER